MKLLLNMKNIVNTFKNFIRAIIGVSIGTLFVFLIVAFIKIGIILLPFIAIFALVFLFVIIKTYN